MRFRQHEAELTDLRQDCGMESKAASYGHGSRWFEVVSKQSVNSQTWITLSMWNLKSPNDICDSFSQYKILLLVEIFGFHCQNKIYSVKL